MNFILFTLVIKGTVRVISSDPPCKDDKPINLIKSGEDIIVFFFRIKVFNYNNCISYGQIIIVEKLQLK